MKKNIVKVLCLMLAVVFALSACSFGKTKNSKEVSLIYYVLGEETKDAPVVIAEVNKILKEKLNTTITPKYVPFDNYSLILSSGEEYDIILTADWLQFWDFAKKDAFLNITDDMLKANAKEMWDEYKDGQLKYGKYNGNRYGLPLLTSNYNIESFITRGDLEAKYNTAPIAGLKSIGDYFGAVKAEAGMIPIEMNKNQTWKFAAIWLNELKWSTPGPQDSTNPITMKVEDPSNKLFKLNSTPEAKEFSLMMKDWSSKGYWSKSALASSADGQNSFLAGKAAAYWANIPTAKQAYNKIKADSTKANWNVKGYNLYTGRTSKIASMNQGVAISANTKNADRALQVINLMRTDEKLNKLICFGIEGSNYKELPNNKFEDINMKDYQGWAFGNDTGKFYLTAVSPWSDMDRVESEAKANYKPWTLSEFVFDNTNVKEIAAALKDFYAQYTAARYLGFVDDVDKAIETESQKLTELGLDKYQAEMQSQVDKFASENK